MVFGVERRIVGAVFFFARKRQILLAGPHKQYRMVRLPGGESDSIIPVL